MNRFIVLAALGSLIVIGGLMAILFLRGGMEKHFENAPLSIELTSDAERLPEEVKDESKVSASQEMQEVSSGVSETAVLPEDTSSQPEQGQTLSPEKNPLDIREKLIAFGFRIPPNGRGIDSVVIHSSYNASGGDVYDIDKIIQQYEDYGVGAHYLIGRKGTIFRLVEERNIAYHAGASKMPDGRQNINDFSIGIELVGTEKSGFTREQYESLNSLIADIKRRYTIRNIVGHSDIAPERRTDPWEFDWRKLSQ